MNPFIWDGEEGAPGGVGGGYTLGAGSRGRRGGGGGYPNAVVRWPQRTKKTALGGHERRKKNNAGWKHGKNCFLT